MIPKRWSGHCWDSFGSTPSCLYGFGSRRFMLCGVTNSFYSDRGGFNFVARWCLSELSTETFDG